MSRRPRIAFPGAVYHVMNRGIEGRDIYADDSDKEKRTELLEKMVSRFDINLFAYVLMDNHDHFFFRTLKPNLSTAMHYFNAGYCTWFNIRHNRRGVLFQSRFRDHLVEEQGHFLELSRYIHLNPVRAGLVENPKDYRWSSYRGYFDEINQVSWIQYQQVLEEFATDEKLAAEQYRKYVEQGMVNPAQAPWDRAIGGLVIGSVEFAERIAISLKEEELPTPYALKALQRPSLEEIAGRVSKATGLEVPKWEKGARDRSLTRALLAYAATRLYGYANSEVSVWLGLTNPASVTRLVKRAKNEVAVLDWISKQIIQMK